MYITLFRILDVVKMGSKKAVLISVNDHYACSVKSYDAVKVRRTLL